MTRLLFFGAVRDAAGLAEREIALPSTVSTIHALRAWLSADDAILGAALAAPGVQVAVDQEIVRAEASISGAAEIAFMSPMSGG